MDLAHTLDRAPVEGVLVEQLARRAGLDVAGTELGTVALQQTDLGLVEHLGGLLARRHLQAHEALVAGLRIGTQPDTAYPRGRDVDARQAQVVRYASRAVGWVLEAVVQHGGLDLLADPVGMRATGAAALLDQGGHAAGLEGFAHLVEGVAVKAYDPGGLGNVAEFLGQLQQAELAFDTLCLSGYGFIS